MANMNGIKSKRALLALVMIGLVCGVSAGLYFYFSSHHRNQHAAAFLTLYGNIDLRQVQLAFDDNGRIKHMNVEAGDSVKRGQVLAVLDSRRYQAALQQANAKIAADQAALDRLLAGTRPQEIARLKALVQADEARVHIANLTYQRLQRLAAAQATSKQKLDEARSSLQEARARLKADRESLALAIAGPRKQDIAQARAELFAAEAAQTLARIGVEDSELRAPEAGVIRDRILEPGDMATPARPVFTLALINPVWARVYVDEPELGRVRPGLPATISSDSYPGKHFKGWVGYVSPTAEFTPKTVQAPNVRTQLVYQVRVYVCNPRHALRLGMPVTVVIDSAAKPLNLGGNPCHTP